jgi:hypothetical protein
LIRKLTKVDDKAVSAIWKTIVEEGSIHWVTMVDPTQKHFRKERKKDLPYPDYILTEPVQVYTCDEPNNPVKITKAKLTKGIRLAAKRKGEPLGLFLNTYTPLDADIAMQLSLFGEVIYE